MITAQEIKTIALDKGACSLIESANSIDDLAKLLKTPQGIEFCKNHSFPSLDILREHKRELVKYDIYVDAGFVTFQNKSDVMVAGDTTAVVSIRQNDKPYFVHVLDGAKAIVNTYRYSVCQVNVIGGDVETHQYDSSIITIK